LSRINLPPATLAKVEAEGAALVVNAEIGATVDRVTVVFLAEDIEIPELDVEVKGADVVDGASGLTRFNVTPAATQSLFAKSTVAICGVSLTSFGSAE
jgi:hypothetical protein